MITSIQSLAQSYKVETSIKDPKSQIEIRTNEDTEIKLMSVAGCVILA
jgi:hypothetical protein